MKKLLLLSIVFIGLSFCQNPIVNAQGVGINPSGNPPDNSAMLDISATNKGTLITRLTTTQRNAISSPAEGLMIFNTTTKCFEAYVNNVWGTISCPCPTPAAPSSGIHTAYSTQIVWNWNPVSGATGYKYNTVNTYSTATDNGTSTSYTQTGLTCGTSYTLYVWAYNTCGNSSSTALTQTTSACFSCGSTLTITHTIGTVAPETKTVNYGTVTSSLSGASKCWITQNLGSSNQATSASDATDAAAGWYWQFNRKQGYAVGPTPAWTTTSISETSNWLAANDPCTIELGTEWRIPTYTEWSNADATGAWTNYTDTYNSVLKLHAAGSLYFTTGTLGARGTTGFYWSSTQLNAVSGYNMYFTPGQSNMNDDWKATGINAPLHQRLSVH